MKRTGLLTLMLLPLLTSVQSSPAYAGDDWTDWMSPPWRKQPTIGIAYGHSLTNREDLSVAPANTGFAELLLGGTRIAAGDSTSSLLRYRLLYFSVANFNSDYTSSPPAGVPTLNIWRFGFGRRIGYGYRLGGSPEGAALLLYNGGDGALSSVDIRGIAPGMPDSSVLSQYGGGARFGTSVSGGILLRVTPLIGIDAGFQRTLVLRRIVFWPWIGSEILEGMLQAGLDGFIDKIGEASPMAKPIAHFVLKNALSFGLSQLRRANAYTPFPSEAPLMLDAYRVGLEFTF